MLKADALVRWFFGFFLFCSILCELLWLGLAMAQFAVTSALICIVLSAFMIGLGLGSWAAGRYALGSVWPLAEPASLRCGELLIGVTALSDSAELLKDECCSSDWKPAIRSRSRLTPFSLACGSDSP